MNLGIFAAIGVALAAILICTTSNVTAHVSYQQHYNDGYNAGQNYANCDYKNCDRSDHGYDTSCPNDKVHTNEFCQGYSLGYKPEWDSLAGGTSTQESQSQAQGGSNVRVDGSHNNVIIATIQSQEQSSSSSVSDSGNADYSK